MPKVLDLDDTKFRNFSLKGYEFILPENYDNSESSSECIFHRNFSNGQIVNKADFLSI